MCVYMFIAHDELKGLTKFSLLKVNINVLKNCLHLFGGGGGNFNFATVLGGCKWWPTVTLWCLNQKIKLV